MKVAVAGCGLAGMAAAIALARDGHQVSLYERFEAPRPLGAGLLLQPSGLAALQALGLRTQVEAAGSKILRLEGKRAGDGKLILDLRYDRWDSAVYGLGVRRAALFDALLSQLEPAGVRLYLGRQILRVETPNTPVLKDAEGEAHGPFDLAIIADGANSSLRPQASRGARAPLYPWGAVWASVTAEAQAWDGALRQTYRDARTLIGVLPTGPAPGEDQGRISAAVFFSLPVDRWEPFQAAGVEGFRRAVSAHWPEAALLLKPLRGLDDLAFATYRHVSAWPWGRGGVILLGDAAHAASPVLGHGANLSLADGVALARALREERGVLLRALSAYRRDRRRFTSWAQVVARLLTPLFQSHERLFSFVRDRALPLARAIAPLERLMLATLIGRARMPIPSITRLVSRWRLPPGA
jgi:2-polyprenyl-6-methoxyphenol hydroxylase-like FAD-dependent oxidoreductase